MKFIHTADIHLDSPLHGLSAYPDAPAEQLRSATRDAFTQLVERALDEAIDFMIIAGDLYDGPWKDYNTGIFFAKALGRLARRNIPVYLLYGNHDCESEITRKLTLPENVQVFPSRKPGVFRLDHLQVALHGQSFHERAVSENLALGYPAPVAGYYNIGVLHTALEGNSQHASYAPCSLEQLHAKGYDYWALGHVHQYDCWRGPATIVFPGNLQGRHIRETGPKGAVLVSVTAGGTKVERIHVNVLQWERVSVEVSACAALAEVTREIGRALQAQRDAGVRVPRAVRIEICGTSPAHAELLTHASRLRADVLAQIAALGNEDFWLEKVIVNTRPVESRQTGTDLEHDLDEITSSVGQARSDPQLLQQLQRDLAAFLSRVPAEISDDAPLLSLARGNDLEQLIERVSPALLARLR